MLNHRTFIPVFILLSTLVGRFYIDLGFALKPYMVVTFILAPIILSNKIYKIKYHPQDLAFIIFFIFGGFSALFSEDILNGTRLFILGFLWFVVYKFMSCFVSKIIISVNDFIDIIYFTGFLFNFISIVLYLIGLYVMGVDFLSYNGLDVYGVTIDRGLPRLIGLAFDPNFFVMLNAPFFFFSLNMKRCQKQKLLFFMSAVTIFLSFSRGGWLAIILVVIVKYALNIFNIWNNKSYEKTSFQKQMIQFFVPSFFVAFMVFWNWEILIDILKKRFTNLTSGSGRSDLVNTMLQLFSENPFFGVGFHNFRHYNLEKTGKFFYGHNTYLELLSEIGLIGFIFYFIYNVIFLIFTINIGKRNPDFKFIALSFMSIQLSSFFLTALLNSALLFIMILASITFIITERMKN